MKNDILKTLAMKAKNRMINKNLRTTYGGADIKIISTSDEEFLSRVREMLASEEDISNPIKRLMDEDKMRKLDDHGRERYLLETIEKYHNAKEIINKDKDKRIG